MIKNAPTIIKTICERGRNKRCKCTFHKSSGCFKKNKKGTQNRILMGRIKTIIPKTSPINKLFHIFLSRIHRSVKSNNAATKRKLEGEPFQFHSLYNGKDLFQMR